MVKHLKTLSVWLGPIGIVASLWQAAVAARGGADNLTAVLIWLVVSFVGYSLLVAAQPQLSYRKTLGVVSALALASGAALVWAPSVLSDDLYRFLWDAHVLRAGIDPFRFAPDDPALAFLRDDYWHKINHPEIPTIYPYGAQLLFLVADYIAHDPRSIKALALVLHLFAIAMVGFAAGKKNRFGAVWLYGLNPLVIEECALGGHIDVAVGMAVLAFGWALMQKRLWLAFGAVAAATSFKLVGPVLWMMSRRLGRTKQLLLLLAILAFFVSPVLAGYGGDARSSAVQNYSTRWQGNAFGFVIVEKLCWLGATGLSKLSGSASGHLELPALEPILRSLADTPFDPRAATVAEKKAVPHYADFAVDYLASLQARLVVLLMVLATGWLLIQRLPPFHALRWTFFVLLLFAPQVHPWYLLWWLPVEIIAGGVTGLVWSAAVLVTYAPLSLWQSERVWTQLPLWVILEYVLMLTAAMVFERRGETHVETSVGDRSEWGHR